MKVGAMLEDVLRSLVREPATERYPFERREAPKRLRGLLHWNPTECTGCGLCAMDCPADAIEVIKLDKKAKRFVIRYYLDRCTFCGQCVESCRKNCLDMSDEEWELAAASKEPLTICYGSDADIEEVLAQFTTNDTEPAHR